MHFCRREGAGVSCRLTVNGRQDRFGWLDAIELSGQLFTEETRASYASAPATTSRGKVGRIKPGQLFLRLPMHFFLRSPMHFSSGYPRTFGRR
jgi:hypothetical protein